MKKTLLIAILTFSLTMAFSQSGFSVYVKDMVIKMDDPGQSRYTKSGYIVNHNNHAIQLRWEKLTESLPQGASIQISDHSSRWDFMARRGLISIKASDTAFFDVHYFPNGQSGDGMIRISLEDVNNQSRASTLTYSVRDLNISAARDGRREDPRVYPNPASDYFAVDGTDHVREVIVINLVGQEVKRFSASLHAKYDISELARGLYLIRLTDKQGKVIKTIRLSKR